MGVSDIPSTGVLSGLHVLLIEEDAHSREHFKHIFELRGAVVTSALSESQALRLFSQRLPDLIVADVSRPSGASYGLIQRVRQLPPELGGQTPAIAVSDLASKTSSAPLRDQGFHAHLVKPVSTDVLVSTIRRMRGTIAESRRLRTERRSGLAAQRFELVEQKASPVEARERLAARFRKGQGAPRELFDLILAPKPEPRTNSLLASLPAETVARLRSRMDTVTLSAGQTLYFLGDRITHVYFPDTAVVSLLCVLPEGETVELGVVGHDGLVGVPRCATDAIARHQSLVQLGGRAMRIEAGAFDRELRADDAFREAVRRYQDSLFNQAAQIAACNRFHVLEQRLCRWLLAVHDRAEGDEMALTHETISNVLGVRRAGVTVAIGALQRLGAISSGRGHITVRDRAALEAGSCGCYVAMKEW